MKKLIIAGLSFLSLGLSSCSFSKVLNCTITLNDCNGNIEEVSVKKLSSYSPPINIERENCSFMGWYLDDNFVNPATSITATTDTTLYAKWSVDENYLENILATDIKKTVITYYEMKEYGTKVSMTQGTAFVFDEDSTYYYLMTNNHVTSHDDSYKILVLDNGTAISNKSTNTNLPSGLNLNLKYKADIEEVYSDADYDLSVVKVRKQIKSYSLGISSYKLSLNIAQFSSNTLNLYDIVVAYGSPEGNRQTLTGGIYMKNEKIDLETDQTSVSFDVYVHTAYITNGSSGGPLFNELGEVVAVNYAGTTTSSNKFISGAAVPLSRINEFLIESNYKN